MPRLEEVPKEMARLGEWLNEESVLKLPMFEGVALATLRRWCSEGKGPRLERLAEKERTQGG